MEERRESRKARRGRNVVDNPVKDNFRGSSSSLTQNSGSLCKACAQDYVPKTPSSSSDESGYFYDLCNLRLRILMFKLLRV